MQSSLVQDRMYQRFVDSCKSSYKQFPDFHKERLAKIISQVQEYSGMVFDVIIQSPLEAAALSEAPNIIRISPAIVVLEDSLLASVVGHEAGHHFHGHMGRTLPLTHSEYEADLYSTRFLAAYDYDLKAAKAYRLSTLNPTGLEEGVSLDFQILHSVVGGAYDRAIELKEKGRVATPTRMAPA